MRRQASRTGADSAERILASMDDPSSQSSTQARTSMVARQLVRRGIEDPRVLEVMARLPREAFVPGTPESVAYDDRALPIDEGQTISQPYIVARMTELLAVETGDRILEIGTGSGYQAAVLAMLGARVVTIERHGALAHEARDRLDRLNHDCKVRQRINSSLSLT